MENLPPHLPRKSCDVKNHHIFNSLSSLVFLVFVSILTSIALTLATLAWIAPTFIPEQLVNNIQLKNNQPNKEDLGADAYNKVKQELWQVYDKRQKIGGKFYSIDTEKLQAVMFSSDGWAVAYAPDYHKGQEKYWEGIDYQGTSYSVEKVVFDQMTNLIYIKFVGEGFPFISFANWNNLNADTEIWSIYGFEKEKYLFGKAIKEENKNNYAIWQPQFFYHIDQSVPSGSLVINKDGQMVGISDESGKIVYGWMVENQFISVLQNNSTLYRAVPWSGSFVSGFVKDESVTKKVFGFYVQNSPTKPTEKTIGAGDLILQIQNKNIDAENAARQILTAPEKFSVLVWRNGKEVEIFVNKEVVNN